MMFSLCLSSNKIFTTSSGRGSLAPQSVAANYAAIRRFPRSLPLQQHTPDTAVALTELCAALSGISRASRFANVSFQRFLFCFPPAIAAVL